MGFLCVKISQSHLMLNLLIIIFLLRFVLTASNSTEWINFVFYFSHQDCRKGEKSFKDNSEKCESEKSGAWKKQDNYKTYSYSQKINWQDKTSQKIG